MKNKCVLKNANGKSMIIDSLRVLWYSAIGPKKVLFKCAQS